jgi:uncharacterized membrane protein
MKCLTTILKWCLGIFLCAWVGQYLLALVIPNLVMEVLYQRGGVETDYNALFVNPRPDETMRKVVRPSPDLLYASCIFNLEQGPVVIESPVPERYWSMQFYQMNTDNFAGITNQRDQDYRIGTVVEVTLIGPDRNPGDYSGKVIQSPTQRGIMLLRASGIGDDTAARASLEKSSCRPA